MPDAKRFKPVAADPPRAADDPRLALAQQYLKKSAAELAEKEAAKPRAARSDTTPSKSRVFAISFAPSTFVHVILASLAFTFASLAVLWCYHLLTMDLTAGRVIALPTGMIVAAVLSYLSVLFLGFIESTSHGRTDVDALQGDWQDWFWTLPSTVGIVALTAFIAWIVSTALSTNVWVTIALGLLLFYPIMQLSTLELGSPFGLVSLPVVQSIVNHPFAWFIIYAISFALTDLLWNVARLAWHDPPYSTVLIMAPLVSVALFFYAWLLGQLAHLIGSGKET